jgi:hypothetical protein
VRSDVGINKDVRGRMSGFHARAGRSLEGTLNGCSWSGMGAFRLSGSAIMLGAADAETGSVPVYGIHDANMIS